MSLRTPCGSIWQDNRLSKFQQSQDWTIIRKTKTNEFNTETLRRAQYYPPSSFWFFPNRILPAVLIRTKSIYCLKSWQLNANILLQLLEMSSPCLNKKEESFNYCKFVLAERVRRIPWYISRQFLWELARVLVLSDY